MYTISRTESENTTILRVTDAKAEEEIEIAFGTLEAGWNYLMDVGFYLGDKVFAGQIENALQEGIKEREAKHSDKSHIFPREVHIRDRLAATILWDDLPVGHHVVKRKSTPAALLEFLEHSSGWAGDDFKKCLDQVYATRGKVKLDVPDGHEL